MISRRQFLIGTAAASVAAASLTEDTDGITLRAMAHPTLKEQQGLGLAPLKAEGQTVSYDPAPPITAEYVEEHSVQLSKQTVWDTEREAVYDPQTNHHLDGS